MLILKAHFRYKVKCVILYVCICNLFKWETAISKPLQFFILRTFAKNGGYEYYLA